jgi:hypothetical protein
MFTSPMFDIGNLFAFADDSFILRTGKNLPDLIKDKEDSLAEITTWLGQSGLKVNPEKN